MHAWVCVCACSENGLGGSSSQLEDMLCAETCTMGMYRGGGDTSRRLQSEPYATAARDAEDGPSVPDLDVSGPPPDMEIDPQALYRLVLPPTFSLLMLCFGPSLTSVLCSSWIRKFLERVVVCFGFWVISVSKIVVQEAP